MQEQQPNKKENNMNNTSEIKSQNDEMRAEYDFSDSIPNKYSSRLQIQDRLIQLEPDVFKIFQSSEDVNNVLRAIIMTYPKSHRAPKANIRAKK